MEKSVQDCVIEALYCLSAESFKRFKVKLCEIREIGYGQIEKGSPVDVAVKIISVFTKAGAVGQTAKVLRAIGLKEEAEALEKEAGAVAGAVRKQENRGDTGQKDGALGSVADGKHFVEKHMSDLINRVTLVPPILDQLFENGFMEHELCVEICNEQTSYRQMRMLMHRVIIPGNDRVKDELYRILEKQQRPLMDDLKGK